MTINSTHHGGCVLRLGDLCFFNKRLYYKDLFATGVYKNRDSTFATRYDDFTSQH